jgi:protein-S-isoprenylcysteine O-methyltransferase Ste14
MDRIGKSPIPVPVLIVGKLALFACALFFVVKLLNIDAMLYDSTITKSIGIFFYVLGFVVMITAIIELGQSLAVGMPERSTELRTGGLYAFSRNPIYLGAFILCAGSCLFSIHMINIFFFVLALLIHFRIVIREEAFLEQRFGEKWIAYRNRVPRYIGRIHRAEARPG